MEGNLNSAPISLLRRLQPCPICKKRHWRHRLCQQDLESLTDLTWEYIEKRQLPGFEDWHCLTKAAERSWPSKRLGVEVSGLFLQVYEALLLRWYEMANTQDYNFLHRFLDKLERRFNLEMVRRTRWQNQPYRRLQLLRWLRQQDRERVPSFLLEEAPRGTRQFRRIAGKTGKIRQVLVKGFSWSRLVGVLGVGGLIALSRLMSNVEEFAQNTSHPQFWLNLVTWGVIGVYALLFLVFFYYNVVVLELQGFYYGPVFSYRYVPWENVYRIRHELWWLRLTIDGGITLFLFVPGQDRRWLGETMRELIRRAQTADAG